jgi:hypothetical protein
MRKRYKYRLHIPDVFNLQFPICSGMWTVLSVWPNFENLLPDLIQPNKKIITKCLTFASEIFSIWRFLCIPKEDYWQKPQNNHF